MGINKSSQKLLNLKKSPSTSLISTASSNSPVSPLDIEIEHLETFILVWLDPSIDDEQNQVLQKRLRQYISCLVTFDDWKSCEQWLKSRSNDEKILLIVSGGFGKRILPNISQLSSIIAIYIFCINRENHLEWSRNYSKIRQVISKGEELIQQISKDQRYFENIENCKSIKIFQNHRSTFDAENMSFISYQLFFEILFSSSYLPSLPSPLPLLQILRRSCSNDQESLDLIKEFEQTYNNQTAISSLIKHTPLERFLNKALHEQNISMIFYLRFFLMDIHNHLKAHQLQSAHVYCKQLLPRTFLQNIQQNPNNYLMFNQFLLTSTQAPDFSTNDKQYESVIIEIDAQYRPDCASFGCVNDQDDSSIVFMCNAIFQILSLKKMNDNSIWILQLSLSSNKDLNILSDQIDKLRKTNDLLLVVDLFEQCNQSDKANIYCQHLLREFPSDHLLIPKTKAKMNENAKIQPVSLKRTQCIMIDLSTRLNRLSSAMFDALRSLTNDTILIYNDESQIDFNTMIHKTILIFGSNQAVSSMKKKHNQLTRYFILEEDKNKDQPAGHFIDSEDLIFELADQLYHCYKWEANEDLRAGDSSSANDKEQLANQIHSQLKKVHQKFSQDDNAKSPISTTTIVCLKFQDNNKDGLTEIENLFKNIVSSFHIFDNVNDCFAHLCIDDYCHFVYLIIDNDYKDVSLVRFPQLHNVKKIYRYNSSLYTDQSNKRVRDNLPVKLTHDLISHYNQLADECEDKNDAHHAKEMFSKARQLCELLIRI